MVSHFHLHFLDFCFFEIILIYVVIDMIFFRCHDFKITIIFFLQISLKTTTHGKTIFYILRLSNLTHLII